MKAQNAIRYLKKKYKNFEDYMLRVDRETQFRDPTWIEWFTAVGVCAVPYVVVPVLAAIAGVVLFYFYFQGIQTAHEHGYSLYNLLYW